MRLICRMTGIFWQISNWPPLCRNGRAGLSTVEEARFLIQGLNAHEIYPDWIALNNGTTHGIEASDQGIQVPLTKEIHEALSPYGISGAQHGTSGNNSERLRSIARETATTKANVATALQMISWGVKVNEYGNAYLDEQGEFVKLDEAGVSDSLWNEMVEYAKSKDIQGGNYKKLNLPFENKMRGQPKEVRDRMVKGVEEFVHDLLVNVFNAQDTAPLAMDVILKAGSFVIEPKAKRIDDPADWTEDKIRERASAISKDKGPKGNFDD
jgi:fructose-bisphosphate aldolase class II